MAELKTKPTNKKVSAFLKSLTDEQTRKDCETLVKIMKQASGAEPVMWGAGIVGFGSYHYRYASGREGDWFQVGFSPRKQNLTLYIMPGFQRYEDLMAKLGPHKTGKSCLYVKRLADVHVPTLKALVQQSVKAMKAGGTC